MQKKSRGQAEEEEGEGEGEGEEAEAQEEEEEDEDELVDICDRAVDEVFPSGNVPERDAESTVSLGKPRFGVGWRRYRLRWLTG
ncbi:unnamed protein product [Hydatigera taeniaeformis]|uniref:Uncharacterized protein n=1 Tax=Hydatigena taeniaeformis TaxID=6205 RepID=A0A0R3WU16_HYDTA|nr:unnamed protein product [Hydatigera taeniaeformis]